MGQEMLVYSFVAREKKIIADFKEFTGNFKDIALNYMQNLPLTNSNFSYTCEGYIYNYVVDNEYVYCVVAGESIEQNVSMAFLNQIMQEIKTQCVDNAATNTADVLNNNIIPDLKKHMQSFVVKRQDENKIAKVKAQVSEVKGVMMDNIEKVLDRGEKIELLVDKTENLRSQAQDFRQQGTKMRRKMWLQNMKIKLIVLGIIVALILIIVLSVCGGFNCH